MDGVSAVLEEHLPLLTVRFCDLVLLACKKHPATRGPICFWSTLQSADNGYDFSQNFRFGPMAQPEKIARRRRARPHKQSSFLQAAGGAQPFSAPQLQNVERLGPNGRSEGRGGRLALAIDREKGGALQIRVQQLRGCAGPKQVADRHIRQSEKRRKGFSEEKRDFFQFLFNGIQKWRRAVRRLRRLSTWRALPLRGQRF
jgi:hypothetical protein